MIVMKIYTTSQEVLLAACDENILGKEFREGNIHIYVDPNFYGDMRVSDEVFLNSMKIATIANLVGEYVVNLAIRGGFINPECVIRIAGVPHAQMARMW
ncbi:MAG: DUF424 domain-containing protein [Thermoplasmata archaeon]|nr:MAG: DUF424 domain-containing protein [Thermoplasmata archaeon]